jgi:hypothetical protein
MEQNPPLVPGRIERAQDRLEEVADLLFRTQSKSLYDRAVLTAALEGRRD